MADTAVARAGKPAMGVSSCFGSPLLNDVLGLGIALTVSCTSVHHVCSVHHVSSVHTLAGFIVSVIQT